MKAFRDYLRTLAEITPQSDELDSSSESLLRWHEAVVNVVFMLFLGLESGRHAIADLVEFQPEKAERCIVILISELEAYRFLRSWFTNSEDVRYQRLNLRESDYQRLVPKLISSVEINRAQEKLIELETEWDRPSQASKWEPAVRLLPELKTRYEACADLWGPPPTTARVGRNNANPSSPAASPGLSADLPPASTRRAKRSGLSAISFFDASQVMSDTIRLDLEATRYSLVSRDKSHLVFARSRCDHISGRLL